MNEAVLFKPEVKTDLSRICVDIAFKLHQDLGSGLLESAYEACFAHLLEKRGIQFERQKSLPIIFDEQIIENAFRVDLLVENELIIELKAVENLMPVHRSQLLTYLRLSKIKTGLLINFNVPLIKQGIMRLSV
jgi:GxxExxY protein